MSLSRDVSNALDILSQQPGAVLVRGDDRWFALDPSEPGSYLALDDEGFPSWDTGLVPVGTSTPWEAVTYQNGWSDYSSSWQGVRYRRTAEHLVIIQGLAGAGTQSSGTPIFTLPVGFRPGNDLLMPTQAQGNDARVRITADGEVQAFSGSGVNWALYFVFGLELP